MYNKVIISGNLTKDVESKNIASGSQIANFSIASSQKYKDRMGETREDVCFVDVTVFGRQAEIALQYLKKGSKVLIDGRLVLEQWNDKQTGQTRTKHSIVAEGFQMIGGRDNPSAEDKSVEAVKKIEDMQTTQVDTLSDVEVITVEIAGAILMVDTQKYDINEQKELDSLCAYFVEARSRYQKRSLINASNRIVAILEKQTDIHVMTDSDKILSEAHIIPF